MIQKDIKISSQFKAQAKRAIIALIFFAVSYLAIFLLAVLLTVACIAGGIMLIAIRPMFLTIALGIGLASMGVLVLIFLLKFIFKSHKTDRSHLTEVKISDEPKLFALIQDVVGKVGTDFPKKVYLSANVNAGVFYDSSFWSMFLPIRKNLEIGIGLVNTVTESELTAILAHEFGHFSQKSMKVGSYVYNVNQVIFNMLYDNNSYGSLVSKWANVSNYFALFATLAIRIIEMIQWVLQKLYAVVNRNYLGLSREMEFHADEIAAHVTGYKPLKTSLLRLTLAEHSLNAVFAFYNEKIIDNVKSSNVYVEQKFVMELLAKKDGIPMSNGLPEIDPEHSGRYNKSKLKVDDQWASHPSSEDRIARLEKANVTFGHSANNSANEIFKNIEKTQEFFSKKLFEKVKYDAEAAVFPLDGFQKEYADKIMKNSFPQTFNGYYDDHNPEEFDLNAVTVVNEIPIARLFSDQMVELTYIVTGLENDIAALKQMSEATVNLKTFDYDGRKYKKSESAALQSKLEKELEKSEMSLKKNDIAVFLHMKRYEREQGRPPKLENIYREFFKFKNTFEEKAGLYTRLFENLQFVSKNTPLETIRSNFSRTQDLEGQLKMQIREMLSDPKYTGELNRKNRENFEKYVSADWTYFEDNKYLNDNLNMLFSTLNDYVYFLSKGYFLWRKEIVQYQDELIKNSQNQQMQTGFADLAVSNE